MLLEFFLSIHIKRNVDELVAPDYKYDWESLRASITTHGLRHSTLSAQMPSESSSVVSNATNGIEPPRDYLSIKKSKKGPLKQIVPSYQSLKNNYTLLWDMENNTGYINVVAVMQNSLIRQSVVTGLIIQSIILMVRYQ